MKQKIMYIHHGGAVGGAGISCYNTAKMLAKHYEVVTYCYDKPMDIANVIAAEGITSKTYSTALGTIPHFNGGPEVFSLRFYKGILYILVFAKKWLRIIKEESPDVLIVNSKLLCWYSVLAKMLDIKCICYIRETAVTGGKGVWNSIIQRFLEKCDGVFFISEYDRQIENLKVPFTCVIPNFLSPESYTSSLSKQEACDKIGVRSDTFNILYVGGISKPKGFDIAVEALRFLCDKPTSLIVAGRGFDIVSKQKNLIKQFRYTFSERRYVESMKELLDDTYLAENVHFIGVRQDMADVYAACDVLVFPARDAHQARPAFEIGMQKKPVIISDYEMTREYVRDGINGLTFEPFNPEHLATAIRRLMDDNQLYSKLGENNYLQTMAQHTNMQAEILLNANIEKVLNS